MTASEYRETSGGGPGGSVLSNMGGSVLSNIGGIAGSLAGRIAGRIAGGRRQDYECAAKEPVSIGGITFDALIDADETWQSDVPSYPVEAGFEVSDTIVIRPVTLTMSLFLTNSPVTWKDLHDEGVYRVQEVIERLEQLYFKKTPVAVKTNERDYGNMAIVSIGLPKKIETGTSKLIPVSLQQVMVTELQTAAIPESYGRGGASGVNAGAAGVMAMTPVAPPLP